MGYIPWGVPTQRHKCKQVHGKLLATLWRWISNAIDAFAAALAIAVGSESAWVRCKVIVTFYACVDPN